MSKDTIELTQYNPQWAQMAQEEIVCIKACFSASEIIDIQHVGSTAIPGMIAKPIIDLQIAVKSLESIKQLAIEILEKHDYVYWYENPDPSRMFFVKGMPPYGSKRTHHLHICEQTSHHWQNKIIFRDYLIANSDIAEEYAQLKLRLAGEYANDREKYTEAKTAFIENILSTAKRG